uniref:Uncharacterized protein n=1 Tax=Anopheles quadriannulatus TaxID=34691 RepID=A0A182XSU1_ANOQN
MQPTRRRTCWRRRRSRQRRRGRAGAFPPITCGPGRLTPTSGDGRTRAGPASWSS